MTMTLNVSGMTCQHCVRAVTAAIVAADPKAAVAVDLAAGQVKVATALPRDQVAALVQAEGYAVAA